jgi:uncharacterized protein (TIGR00730 family)
LDGVTEIKRVTVFGSSSITPASAEYEQAMLLGRLLAEAGYEVVNGGQKGSMQAVARGVSEAGGRCIGITVRDAPWGEPTAWAAEIVRHDDLLIRMRDLLVGSDAWIALPGQIGTLAEVAVGWVLLSSKLISTRHLILVGPCWKQAIREMSNALDISARYESLLTFVETPEAVLETLKS